MFVRLLFFFAIVAPLFVNGMFYRPGGWEDGEPDDPEIQKMVTTALGQLNKSDIGLNILTVQSQVVNGIKYKITFTFDEGGDDVHTIELYKDPCHCQCVDKVSVSKFE